MVRLAPLLPVLALAACVTTPPPPAAAGRTAVEQARPAATPDLRGRWTVTAVNKRPESGLWLELGGEGLATITTKGNAVYVGSPQPLTQVYLGCNWWTPSGWTRSGDKLILGVEMSRRTERGCDAAIEALDDEAFAIVTKTITMAFTPPNHLRLSNEQGTLELVRTLTAPAATAFIAHNVRAGAPLAEAIDRLVRGGFACRRLGRHEYGPAGSDGLGPKETKMHMCYVATERTAQGYQLVYANLSADTQDRLTSVDAGSYPLIYRNIRTDSQGRVTVVRDPSQ